MTSTLPPVLSIAGSDSSGGAGIQADLKTMLANGVFGMTAIAALTAQNTTGVTMVTNTPPEMLAAQIDAVFDAGLNANGRLCVVLNGKTNGFLSVSTWTDSAFFCTSGD